LDAPVCLASGVQLVVLPDWVKSQEALEGVGSSTRQAVEHFSKFAFYIEYEAENFDERTPDLQPDEPTKRVRAEELVAMANLALWIAIPTPLSFNLFLHSNRPGDPSGVIHKASVAQLSPHPWHKENMLTQEHLKTAGILHQALSGLARRGTVWTAAGAVWDALHSARRWELRVLLFWMALEALYGPNDTHETTHQLSERLALFLGRDENEDEARRLYVVAKKGYAARSRIVHGLRVSGLDDDAILRLGCSVEYLAQRSLQQILTDSDVVNSFDSSERDKFLSGLIFRHRPSS
jgi:hypothetical protein